MPKTNRFPVAVLVTTLALACGGQPAKDTPAPTASAAPLQPHPTPHANYAVQWISHVVPGTFTRGAAVPVTVTVKNTGDWPWPDPRTAQPTGATGEHAVRLGYYWFTSDGRSIHDGTRTDLAAPLAPGGEVTLAIPVTPPADPGDYRLQLDLVEERVTWFRDRGADTLVIPVRVE